MAYENDNATQPSEHQADDNVAAILQQATADPLLSTGPQGEVPAAPEEVSLNNAADAKELLEFAHESLAPLYPRAAAIYTPEIRERLSLRIGALMDKYGLSCGGLIQEWGPEIGLMVVVVPLIGKTAQAVAEDNAAYRAAQEAAGLGKTESERKGGQFEKTSPTQGEQKPPTEFRSGNDLYAKA